MTSCNDITKTCWICQKAIALEECIIDENGRPVHEDCYICAVKLKDASQPIHKSDDRRNLLPNKLRA